MTEIHDLLSDALANAKLTQAEFCEKYATGWLGASAYVQLEGESIPVASLASVMEKVMIMRDLTPELVVRWILLPPKYNSGPLESFGYFGFTVQERE